MQSPGLLQAAYTYPDIETTPKILNTSAGYGRELSNLAKIYTDDAKYSSRNNSFIF